MYYIALFFSLFPLMQSLLSGDFEDLLCESLEASSVKEERGQVSGVEGEGDPRRTGGVEMVVTAG